MEGNKGPAIGIDLGTTYSCVGVWQNNKVEIIANDLGARTTPSFVAFTDSERLIGEAALLQASRNPENTVFDAKRMIGRKWSDEEIQADMKHWPFRVISKGDNPFIEVNFQAIADSYLGTDVKQAVITVPAYFNDAQRVATKQAGQIAGLDVLRIINEPTSAAIAYGLESTDQNTESTILVFDYGGGTLDVSILNLEGGVFEVKATGGDTHLGGEDIDNIIVGHFMAEFKRKESLDISNNQRAIRRLRTACEKAKRTLSSSVQASIELDSLFEGRDFYSSITRARFEELCAEEFRKCLQIVIKVLADSKIPKTDINEVVLVGGSTRIPKIVELLEGFFQGKKMNKSINPDEAVAYGAAVQAGILTGAAKGGKADNILLLDVIPLNLGIETQGGVMAVVLPRNTVMPTSQKKIFSTTRDGQDHVDVKVYEGERPNVRDCNLLGKFTLEGIPTHMKRAEPQIEVTFDVDANGILNVSAEELSSKKKGQITIRSDKGRLSGDQIEKMLKEAEEYAARDKELIEITDWMNSLENYAFNIKNTLDTSPVSETIDAADRSTLEQLARDLQSWLDSHQRTDITLDEVKSKRKEAEAVYNPIMAKVYEKVGHTVDPQYAEQQKQQSEQGEQGEQGEHEQHGHDQ
eukprot:TRINITY_DN239_c0_g1_i4.p1 TRINITY_DN239_c0_g1~~TRINITY_DN239_c0_g1_i4.p1  ORF type:complete len:636 (-),score=218.40 TRINITY_DN239_c0_g1_i4:77-1984(-)